MTYEMLKHTGELPIIGVNTFRNPKGDPVPDTLELARSTEEEKQSQLKRLQDFIPVTKQMQSYKSNDYKKP
jgi:methylmalonyl-CoA mutase